MDSWIFGHSYTLLQDQNTTIWERWAERYGSTMRLRGYCGSYELCTFDAQAVNYICSNNTLFPKTESDLRQLALFFGEGILSVDEETHKYQNPAFGPLQIRNMVPIFWAKANQLRDIWLDMLYDAPRGTTVDVLSWMTRTTLDVIGIAGFGYEFRSLEGDGESELAQAFAGIFNSSRDITTFSIVKDMIYNLLGIPTEASKRFQAHHATIRRISIGLVHDKKMLLQASKGDEEFQGRDLLTLLLKSNIATKANGNQKMSDEELFGQIATFFSAGHETTSSSTTWALYALTQHRGVQSKLRHELQSAGLGDEPSMEELEELPYLNNFVREVLRAYNVVPMRGREAGCDTVIPVGKSFTDVHGIVQKEIRVKKGDAIIIPMLALNRAKDVWGEDAMEFRPERWDNLPHAVKDMPGVWSHIMTFLHGPHACIGYRFSVVEMKVLLYSLVRAFEFDIDPHIEIEGRTSLVTRPCVKSDPEKVNRMPLLCVPIAKMRS
ncbi:Cytochrome P450 family protein [Ceratobasidium theobromae]|uniref:Cytochrome P450 family protein n=1 Tax=Ceratobasidium theobromae TaxID=1582974 RepID=A0A5N5QAH1_9AGAM|nr:Cytochrome P450 family protein [Ceratobasidium theobromae]